MKVLRCKRSARRLVVFDEGPIIGGIPASVDHVSLGGRKKLDLPRPSFAVQHRKKCNRYATPNTPGFCYLRAVIKRHRARVSAHFGLSSPTLEQIDKAFPGSLRADGYFVELSTLSHVVPRPGPAFAPRFVALGAPSLHLGPQADRQIAVEIATPISCTWFVTAAPDLFGALARKYIKHLGLSRGVKTPGSHPAIPPLNPFPVSSDPLEAPLEQMPWISDDVQDWLPETPTDTLPFPRAGDNLEIMPHVDTYLERLYHELSESAKIFYHEYLQVLPKDIQLFLLDLNNAIRVLLATAGERLVEFADALHLGALIPTAETLLHAVHTLLMDFVFVAASLVALPRLALTGLKLLQLLCISFTEHHGANQIYRRAHKAGLLAFGNLHRYVTIAGPTAPTRVTLHPPIRLRNLLDKTIEVPTGSMFNEVVTQMTNVIQRGARNIVALPRIILPENLPMEVLEDFQSQAGEYAVVAGVNTADHPLLAAGRKVFRDRIAINATKLSTPLHLVGGSHTEYAFFNNVSRNNAPILSGRDHKRYFSEQNGDAAYSRYCSCKFEECTHAAAGDQVVALFSAHDIDPEDFIRCMVERNQNRAFIALNLPFPLLDERVKQYTDPSTNLHYEREGDSLFVFHVGSHTAGYKHKFSTVKKWMMNLPVFSGVHVQAELIGQFGTSVCVQLDVNPGSQEIVPTMWSCQRDAFYILPELLDVDLQRDGTRHFAVPARRFEQMVAYTATLSSIERDTAKIAGKLRGLMAEVRVGKHSIDPRWSLEIAQFYSLVQHAVICDTIMTRSINRQTNRLRDYYNRVDYRHSGFIKRQIQQVCDAFCWRLYGEADPSQIRNTPNALARHVYNPYHRAGEYRLINTVQKHSDNLVPVSKVVSSVGPFFRLVKNLQCAVNLPVAWTRQTVAPKVKLPPPATETAGEEEDEDEDFTDPRPRRFHPEPEALVEPLKDECEGDDEDWTDPRPPAFHEEVIAPPSLAIPAPVPVMNLDVVEPFSDQLSDDEELAPAEFNFDAEDLEFRDAPVVPLPVEQIELVEEDGIVEYDDPDSPFVQNVEDIARDSLLYRIDPSQLDAPIEYPLDFDGPFIKTASPLDTLWSRFADGRPNFKKSIRVPVAVSGAVTQVNLAFQSMNTRPCPKPYDLFNIGKRNTLARCKRMFGSATGNSEADKAINDKLAAFLQSTINSTETAPVKLLHINGPPMSAKSTLARIFAKKCASRVLVYVPSQKLGLEWAKDKRFAVMARISTRFSRMPVCRSSEFGPDLGIIDEVYNFSEIELQLHIRALSLAGVKRILLIGDKFQNNEDSIRSDSPILDRSIEMNVSLGMPLDAHYIFTRVNGVGGRYFTTGTKQSSIGFSQQTFVHPETTFSCHSYLTPDNVSLSIGKMQGARVVNALFCAKFAVTKTSWLTAVPSRVTVAFTRHTGLLAVEMLDACRDALVPNTRFTLFQTVNGRSAFEAQLAPARQDLIINAYTFEGIARLRSQLECVNAAPIVSEAMEFTGERYTHTNRLTSDFNLVEQDIQNVVHSKSNFNVVESCEEPIAADGNGATFRFVVPDPAVQKTFVRSPFEDAHKLAAIHHSASAADNWKNLVERQLGPSASKCENISAQDVKDAAKCYARFKECFYDSAGVIYPGEHYLQTWLATRDQSNINMLATAEPFGESSKSFVADAEFKTQSKAKAKACFAATLPYGQSIIANAKNFNAKFGNEQPKIYQNLPRLLRPGVILDYGMTDDELSEELRKLGKARAMNGPRNFQADLTKQDSSHNAVTLLVFVAIALDCGADADVMNFYTVYCSRYAFAARTSDLTRGSVSFNLGSGDPFTLIRNDVMEMTVICCTYECANTMLIVEKGDDVHGEMTNLNKHALATLPALSNCVLTTDYGTVGYHAGRFHDGKRYLVDPIRAFMKHLTRLPDENVSALTLWRSYVSRATDYSETEIEFLRAACQQHYDFYSAEEVYSVIDFMVSIRDYTTFIKYCDAKPVVFTVDVNKGCLAACVKVLKPRHGPAYYKRFRALSLEDAKLILQVEGIPFIDVSYSMPHPIPVNTILLNSSHARLHRLG